MKARIERQQLAGGGGRRRNLKLGHGGIREVEFFAQALQLVNGGYDARIRKRNTLEAISEPARCGYVPATESEALSTACRFLRNAEHKIRIFAHEQSQEIPEGADRQRALARRLNHIDEPGGEADAFWKDYRKHTGVVHAAFDRLFYSARKETSTHGDQPEAEIWQDLERREWVVRVRERGFPDPDKAYRDLLALRDGSGATPSGPKRRKVMRDLMPALMKTILDSRKPQQALGRMAEFGHRIGAHTGFLTLLAENPKTTRLLIDLFANSRFLSDLFVNRPELLDSLIRVNLTRIAKTGVEMREEVNASIAETFDVEEKLDGLRRHRVEEFIRLGLHDLGGEPGFDESTAQLTGLAEVCLDAALTLVRGELDAQYGVPAMERFAVLAMGKPGEA